MNDKTINVLESLKRIDDRLTRINERVIRIDERLTSNALHLDNVTDKNIMLLKEQY